MFTLSVFRSRSLGIRWFCRCITKARKKRKRPPDGMMLDIHVKPPSKAHPVPNPTLPDSRTRAPQWFPTSSRRTVHVCRQFG
ncbi:hypothetical protein CPAR01_08405 [Colletotrichum paranaense]|uniref:Uncharacterized protein n=4 Tax=Colletotrichum acutatum species complex TaxID=2707335 RepID=A0AAJ0E899_9PEZI|nr:uncharacterized protein CCOS01_00808 [Colletotrichum costaricense]XP_060349043.1 uncharacterized protein CPAR01_08405 [Colletotrichum paranaense]XP_060375753.1 uncharacterized protein CTAM01_13657 [Colletotrichum tamarilloi]XP_060400969.1 uncharacterized protein CABS01_08721 [Colletotrichum abscissum]KAI3550346.1 hypothetical protein CSPX01_01944 [Colletotrichum filicis]KAK1453832.1 hypothetical protein CMEL01_05491 [Colletotrichum melonis]KAK1718614.1 hypothetical protein BDP67DRAFT_20526